MYYKFILLCFYRFFFFVINKLFKVIWEKVIEFDLLVVKLFDFSWKIGYYK